MEDDWDQEDQEYAREARADAERAWEEERWVKGL